MWCGQCLQSPGSPFGNPKPGSGRIILVRTGAAEGSKEGLLLGVRDDPLSPLGRVQSSKAAELMMDTKVGRHTFCRVFAANHCYDVTAVEVLSLKIRSIFGSGGCNLQQPTVKGE